MIQTDTSDKMADCFSFSKYPNIERMKNVRCDIVIFKLSEDFQSDIFGYDVITSRFDSFFSESCTDISLDSLK